MDRNSRFLSAWSTQTKALGLAVGSRNSFEGQFTPCIGSYSTFGADSQLISFTSAPPTPISRVGASPDQVTPVAFNHWLRHTAQPALSTRRIQYSTVSV